MRQPNLTLPSDLPRGFAVERYLVLERIGSGRQGGFYLAYEPESGRKVALKVFQHDDLAAPDSGNRRSQLLQEARILARLSHPQLIPVYKIGEIGETGTRGKQSFVAMAFIDGLTLPNWLWRQARSKRDILDVFIMAGRGLQAARKAGLGHARFKPDSILITPQNQVYVNVLDWDDETSNPAASSIQEQLQFPFAKAVDSDPAQEAAPKREGSLRGTGSARAAAKPEAARTELYNFCAALYEALYNLPPSSGNMGAETGANPRALLRSPGSAGAHTPSGWLRQALLRGLHAEPARSQAGMDSLLATLSRRRHYARWWWSYIGAAVMLGAVLLLAWYVSVQVKRQHLLCSGAAAKLVAVWDPPRKNAIHDAFRRTGKPFAEETWQRVEQALNRYSAQWVSMHNEICELTHVRREQSDALLDVRMRCLDRRLAELTALTQRLDAVDESWLDKVTSAAQSLPPLSVCADVISLTTSSPELETPAKRERAAALQQELSGIQTMQRLGEYVKSQKPAQGLVETAHALGYASLEAEALNLLATAQNQRGQSQEAIKTLRLAAAAAIAGRDLRVAAQAFTNLVLISGYRLQLPEEVRKWDMLASAALSGSGANLAGQVELASARCLAAFPAPLQERTLSLCQESLAAATKFYGPTHYFVSVQLNNMAVILGERKQLDQALQLFRQSLAITQQQLGANHPRVAVRLMNIGEALGLQGKYAEAIPYVGQAFELQQRLLEPDNPQNGITLSALGRLQWGAGQLGAAQAALIQAVPILKKGFPATHSFVVETQVALMRTLLAGQQNLEAERLGKQAVAEAGAVAPGRSEFRDLYYYLGHSLARQHRFDEALQQHRRALGFHEKAGAETAIVGDLSAIGADLLGLKRAQEAVALLEGSVQRSAAPAISAEARAASQFALARGLLLLKGRSSFERVLSLLRAARAVYAQGGPTLAAERAELDRWLSEQNIDLRDLRQKAE